MTGDINPKELGDDSSGVPSDKNTVFDRNENHIKLPMILLGISHIINKSFLRCLHSDARTPFSLSHRGPEFWPGGRHRHRRTAGSGHRHRRGDCRGEEDGQILVSTSPASSSRSQVEVGTVAL